MGKMAELAQDVIDLDKQGMSPYTIARMVGVSEFIVRQILDDQYADEPEEEQHPWQN